jgi:twitching motility protein PilT
MPQIDRFIGVMIAHRGDALRLTSGDVARMDREGTAHPITKQPITTDQLLALLAEAAPPDVGPTIKTGSPVRFRYTSTDGVFEIDAITSGDGTVTASVIRDTADNATASTAAATNAHATNAHATNGHATNGHAANGNAVNAHVGNGSGAHASVGNDTARAEIDALLRRLIESGSSDLHLRVGEPPMLRKDGEMERMEGFPALEHETITRMLLAIMPERNRQQFHEIHDTDWAYEIADVARFRANALMERKGAGAVFRAIPSKIVTAEQLGISQEVQNLCYLSKGLVLVTGPTGSGKSTTLCGMVDLVNRMRTDHVITIEDPIEFVHPNKSCVITQREVGTHTGSFKHALRAALREDPDIILVGELRDLETVSIAIETAETGHLVFGTLHTSTAPSTVDRIIDQFPPDRQSQVRVMLSESLKGVISQTLCRKVGGGRVAAREIMLTTPAVSNLIREGKTYQLPSIIQTSKKLGMITLNDALIEYVDKGQVEPREAYVKAVDKTGFATLLKTRNHDTSFIDGSKAA